MLQFDELSQQQVDEYFMREAIKEAEFAVISGDWAMGCVVVINNKIISRSHNKGYSTNNRLAHAEFIALEKAKEELEKFRHQATIYTTYEPCPMCFGAMIIMKVKRCVTGIDLDGSGALDMNSNLPKFYQQEKFSLEILRGILPGECEEVYRRGKPFEKHQIQYLNK